MTDDEVYRAFTETGSLLEGHFELRSGLHSDRYFQCAILLSFPLIARKLCVALAEKLRTEYPDSVPDAVIAPAMGGIVVGHELAAELDARSIFAEKQNDKLVLRRFFIVPGHKYVVAEDVVTRGGRVQEIIDIVRTGGGIVTAVALLVDRSGGKADFKVPTVKLLKMEPVTYEPKKCPLCAKHIPLVHPGS